MRIAILSALIIQGSLYAQNTSLEAQLNVQYQQDIPRVDAECFPLWGYICGFGIAATLTGYLARRCKDSEKGSYCDYATKGGGVGAAYFASKSWEQLTLCTTALFVRSNVNTEIAQSQAEARRLKQNCDPH